LFAFLAKEMRAAVHAFRLGERTVNSRSAYRAELTYYAV
jgi:hypothetical protein